MIMVLCTSQFLKCQGYQVKDNVIYQDNQTSMLLERNGRAGFLCDMPYCAARSIAHGCQFPFAGNCGL